VAAAALSGAGNMSALVRITTGIMPQHSRVGMARAMAQFGEVIHCHKPPYSGIPGEDFVNVRFGSQDAADRAYASLKASQVFVDGFPVGVGPTPGGGGGGGGGKGGGKGKGGGGYASLGDFRPRRSVSPPRHFARNRQRSPYNNNRRRSPPRRERSQENAPRPNFPSRGDAKSASPRRLAREMALKGSDRRRSRTRSRSPPEQRYRRPAYREERGNEFSGGTTMAALPPRPPAKPVREASPDPPGPVKNPAPVKNPFFKQDRSPTPELYDPNGGNY